MKKQILTGALAAATLTVVSGVQVTPAEAASLTVNLAEFTGDNAGGKITLTDEGTDIVKFLVEITSPTVGGDIRGVFFDVLGGTTDLTVTGDNVTAVDLSGTCNLGGGNNLNGGGSPCPLDVAVEIGNPGASGGLIQSTTFSVFRSGLSVNSFLNQDFGLRYQATGGLEGSSKLKVAPNTAIPTPALLPGLLGMGVAALRKRQGGSGESTGA